MERSRQLILLCDGTNNNLTGRAADTQVVLLAELLRQHPDPQRLTYYDPGVGNPGQLPGTTPVDKLGRFAERLGALAFGRGVFDNIAEGYLFLMRSWQPGDQIWLFGFSRGAFTARSIGGLVNSFGILDRQYETLVPSLIAAYFSDDSAARRAIRAQTSRLFAQGDDPADRPFVHFVGVWDTVASVGLPPFNLRIRAKPDLAGKYFRHVRQALSLDEQRAQFRPRAYAEDDGAISIAGDRPGTSSGTLRQLWFRGSHCDVGGGYRYASSEQARAPFAWMLAEAVDRGLRLSGIATPFGEQEALALMATLDPPGQRRQPACLGNETWSNPMWAITGLAVRDTARAAVDDTDGTQIRTSLHPSVAKWRHTFPRGTVWKGHWSAGRWFAIVVALALALYMPLVLGQLLEDGTGVPWFNEAQQYLAANAGLQRWQFDLLASHGAWSEHLFAFAKTPAQVVKAILWDQLFIAAWGFVLAHLVTPAFAYLAGLTRHNRPAPRLLNRLGLVLLYAVGADLAENALTLLALGSSALDWLVLTWVMRVLLFAASLAKWVCLAGVLVLLAGGAFGWLKHRAWQRG
jgi:hypothetical protein